MTHVVEKPLCPYYSTCKSKREFASPYGHICWLFPSHCDTYNEKIKKGEFNPTER